MAGPADHWPPTVGAFWFHYWLEFWLQFWATSIAAQRAADLGAQLGAKAGHNAGRPQLHIVRDWRRPPGRSSATTRYHDAQLYLGVPIQFRVNRQSPITTSPRNAIMLRHACGFALANKGHDTRALQAYRKRRLNPTFIAVR
jgi:hypothetical protein